MKDRAFIARPLNPSDNDVWDALALRYGGVFDLSSWTGLFGTSLNRIGIYDRGNVLRGGFCTWEIRKFGLKVLRNPPYTPRIGPFFEPRATIAAIRTNEQRKVVEAVAEYLTSSDAAVISLSLSLGISDCLPFFWRGWKVIPYYTYRIDLTHDENELLSGMSTERRKNIRKAKADGIIVEQSDDTDLMRGLVIETFSRQHLELPLEELNRILDGLRRGEGSYMLIARQDGQPAAGVFIVHDLHTAYYLIGGYADGSHHGAGALAMWHAILRAKQLGLEIFDFEGSVIPAIERYFRGFGGSLTPVFSINKAWLPVEVLLKMFPKYRNRF